MKKTAETKNTIDGNLSRVVTMQELSLPNTDTIVSPKAFAISLRVLFQNWRQGTVACKGRSDVARSNKKPWKQKGTGRARAGSARSPLWRGGGVTFGPQPRTRTLSIGKKVRRKVMYSVLLNALETQKIVSIDWQLKSERAKTAEAAKMLKLYGLHKEKVTLFLSVSDVLTYASFANIANVQILYFDQPNAFDLVNSTKWLVLKKDMEDFKQMVARWI